MKYIREKKVHFGDGFLDVDLYEMDDSWEPPEKRARRKRITPPHIVSANDRHSKNHLRQLIVHNFRAGDYYITPTYSGEPPDLKTAQKEAQNYLRRLQRLYERNGLELRAIYVTEGGKPKKGGGFTRVHHHFCINGGLPREEIEQAWCGKQPRGAPYRRGFCNTVVMRPGDDERGVERIAEYMAKSRTKTLGKGVRRWNATRNIRRPVETVIDNKFSRSRTEELAENAEKYTELIKAKNAVKCEQYESIRRILERRYRREVIDILTSVSPITGRVYISARFRQTWKE